MDLDGTFIIELIIFGAFYYFVKACIWPRFAGVLEERRIFIDNGLQAAKEGQMLLNEAHKEAEKIIQQAHLKAQDIVNHTHKEMVFFRDQVRQEMDAFKINVQKEVLAECDHLKSEFMTGARAHYLNIATTLCEKVLWGHPEFCQKAVEEILVQEGAISSEPSSWN